MNSNIKSLFNIDDLRDLLLVSGIILAPMTGLRVWKIGPAEVICLLYCLFNYKSLRYIPRKNIFIKFWFGFLFASSLGTLWGTYKYPLETSAKDLITWIYLAVICVGTHLILKEKNDKEIISILTIISYGTAIWYYALYQYSRSVSYYFLGAPLWFAGVRFTGGANNPHQIALLLGFGLIILTWLILSKKAFMSRVINIILFFVTLFLLRQTKSTTAIMAVIVGIVSLVWQHIWIHYKDKKTLFITIVIFALLLVLLFGLKSYHAFMNWVAADKNGMDRFEIFSSFPNAFLKGPVFGLGPGIHARNGYQEFHNSYLEIAAMSGLVGVFYFMALTFRLFNASLKNPISFGATVAGYIYGLAGFGARRLVYWMIIVLAYSLAKESHKKDIVLS